VELSRREGQRRTILKIVYPGNVDGDISLTTWCVLGARRRLAGPPPVRGNFDWLVAARLRSRDDGVDLKEHGYGERRSIETS
jgi:hypothetical protein